MLSMYMIILPILGLLTCLSLIILKLTFKQPLASQLKKYQRRKSQKQKQSIMAKQEQQFSSPGFKKTYFYLLKNFTLIQWACTRRPRNKIPFLLDVSIVATLALFLQIQYAFCFVGTATAIIFSIGKMIANNSTQTNEIEHVKQASKQQETINYRLDLIFTSLTLSLNLLLIWAIYRNFNSSLLSSAGLNFIITIALDNFIIKPLTFAVYSIPIKNLQFVDSYINVQSQIVQILHGERILKSEQMQYISALSPKKLKNSPSKVPKALPRVKPQDKQTYLSTLTLHNPRNKLSPLCHKKACPQGEQSLISLFGSNQRKPHRTISYDFDKQFSQKVIQQQDQISKFNFQTRKQSKLYNSKLLVINPDKSIINQLNRDEVENQEDQDFKSINHNSHKDNDQKSLKSYHNQNSSNKNFDVLKISRNISGYQDNQAEQQFQDQPYPRPQSTLEEDNSVIVPVSIHTSRKNGLLKIHQDRRGEDLEQIDLNSPQRRNNKLSKVIQQVEKQKQMNRRKKGHKKYSLDPNRYVIKTSTGQPYLQFLPNLLNKQREQKFKRAQQQGSQQQLSRKFDSFKSANNENRVSKSVKRTKNSKDPFVRQNDQNKVPQFIIEDFQ